MLTSCTTPAEKVVKAQNDVNAAALRFYKDKLLFLGR
jgi:hypothetical protein